MQSKYPKSTSLSLSLSHTLMENRFKLRISRMFRGSFGSCRPRSMSDVIISDVMEKPVFVAHNQHRSFQMMEVSSPKHRPFPAMCRPRCPERCEMVEHSCIVAEKVLPRRKVSERYSVFGCGDAEGRRCPPASPASPLNGFYNVQEFGSKEKRSKKKKKKKAHVKKNKIREINYMFSSSSADTNGGFAGGGWFSSEDEREDETETLFSSKSLSSDSSESQKRRSRRGNQRSHRRRGAINKGSCHQETDVLPFDGKVKDSFAVVKRSSDPYSDFRTSMLEMIVEKQIFAAKDLEQLLQCFLSLNSSHHHRIIIEVFTEIWEALFSNWS